MNTTKKRESRRASKLLALLAALALPMSALSLCALAATPAGASGTTPTETNAVNWAISKTGNTSYDEACLKFVTVAYQSGANFNIESLTNYGTFNNNTYPQEVWNDGFKSGTTGASSTTPPYGALVFFNASGRGAGDLGDSHVTIMSSNGEMISTNDVVNENSVHRETMAQVKAAHPYNTYVGWWLPDGRTGSSTTPPSQPAPGGTTSATTSAETAGGVTNTWTNYSNAGGTGGPRISKSQTVQVACRIQGFAVGDGNTWWYEIASSPWNDTYYASADAFYNNGRTSGSLAGTPFVDTAVSVCGSPSSSSPAPSPAPAPAPTFAETVGGPTNTWTNYSNAGGTQGPTIAAHQTVQIACTVQGFRVADGNTAWYRIASSPWNNEYYASADAFYNNGQTSGSLAGTPFVDTAVPSC
jgi:hypothetical protein